MIIDLKYHVASLVAVFLALGVGIIIGSTLIGESLVQNIQAQQDNIINKLEQDYLGLKGEVKFAQDEILLLQDTKQMYEKYMEETLSSVITGSLQGRKVAIIEAYLGETPESFVRNLKLAGAEVTSIIQLQDAFYELQIPDIKELAVFFQCSPDLDPIQTYLVEYFANIYVHGREKKTEKVIEKYAFRRLLTKPESVDTVIFVNTNALQTSKKPVQKMNLALESSFIEQGIRVYSTTLEKNLQHIPGQVSLILKMGEIKEALVSGY